VGEADFSEKRVQVVQGKVRRDWSYNGFAGGMCGGSVMGVLVKR
jgi:hypothetical protein